MNNQFPYDLEWEETKFAMNANNKLELVAQPFIIKKQVFTNDYQMIEGLLTINNKKDHDFQDEFKKMIHNTNNKQLIKQYSNQKDRNEKSITQISQSIISQDILPNEIKQNNQYIQNFGDKNLFLIIKGEGFSQFRIRSINFRLQCPYCKQYFLSYINKIQSNIIQLQSDCKQCQQQMNLSFQKQIQQQSINLSQWLIGSIKINENIEWQLNAIEVSAICKCLSNNSRLPYLVFNFEKTKNLIQQNIESQKCQITDQIRQLCHGCVQELKFQPEWLIVIKQ